MVLLALALLWPALVQQRPAYFWDTTIYLNAGTKAIAVGKAKFGARLDALTGASRHPAAQSESTAATAKVGGVISMRAVAYSLFAAMTAWPGHSMWLLIGFNAIVMTLLIWQFWRVIAPDAPPGGVAIAAFLVATATSAPWFVSYAMPDVFAGAAILALAILTFAPLHQHIALRLAVAAVVVFAVAAHTSHILIIGLLVIIALSEMIYGNWRGRCRWSWGRAAWISLPFLGGLVVVVALSLVGFGTASVAPKRLPFALAKSIDDGPGAWYLEASCPTKRWAVCPFFYATNHGGMEMIVQDGGLLKSATPAEMDAVRAEEMAIVRAATAAYPWFQARAAAKSSVKQFFRFGLLDNGFEYVILKPPGGDYRILRQTEPHAIRPASEIMIFGGVALALAYVLAIARSLNAVEAGTLRLVLAGLVANAAVMGGLSGITDRYQGRVIWVLPVMVLGLWLARRPKPCAAPAVATGVGAALPAQM